MAFRRINIQVIQNCQDPTPQTTKKETTLTIIVKFTIKVVVPTGAVVNILCRCGLCDFLKDFFEQQTTTEPTPAVYIYDTDTSNNNYIKGTLSEQELDVFDNLLEYERSLCGPKLPREDVEKYSTNDQDIFDAYYRWRRCKELLRSKSHTVYPSERHLVE